MKTIITFLTLSCTSFIFGQKMINLNFWVRSNGPVMSHVEIKFYSTQADTLLHTAITDDLGYIIWKNAPRVDMKAVFFDSTYTYEPNTSFWYKKELSEELHELYLQKLSSQEYKSLLAAMEKSSSDSIKDVIDEKGTIAEYTGGREALVTFLQKNIQVPSSAAEVGLNGKVYVCFVVEADGSIKSLTVKKSLTPDTDFETMRVVSIMPKWKPATYNGVAIPMYYTLPIVYNVM